MVPQTIASVSCYTVNVNCQYFFSIFTLFDVFALFYFIFLNLSLRYHMTVNNEHVYSP